MNQGYCEIAFHKNNALRLTSFSKKVLFEKEQVNLTRPVEFTEQVVVDKNQKQQKYQNLKRIHYLKDCENCVRK